MGNRQGAVESVGLMSSRVHTVPAQSGSVEYEMMKTIAPYGLRRCGLVGNFSAVRRQGALAASHRFGAGRDGVFGVMQAVLGIRAGHRIAIEGLA